MKKFLAKSLYGVFIILLVGVAGLFLAPLLPISNNIEIKIVRSGSMEPAIKTGSIVVIRHAENYSMGDVITFGEDTLNTFPTTHRIIDVKELEGEMFYQVKGDANEEEDPQLVPKSAVVGKVLFTVPNAGYVLDFARQPIGFIMLIALPALLVIVNESIDIGREIIRIRRKKKKKNDFPEGHDGYNTEKESSSDAFLMQEFWRYSPMDDVIHPIPSLHIPALRQNHRRNRTTFIAGLSLLLSFSLISAESRGTISYFSDIEPSLGNTMSASSFGMEAWALQDETYVGETGSANVVMQISPTPTGLPHEYQIVVEKTGGSDAFCQSLSLVSTTPPPFVYTGSLFDFAPPPTTYSGEWNFEVGISEGEHSDIGDYDQCLVDFVFISKSWLEDKGTHGGYSDIKRVSLTFDAHEPAIVESFVEDETQFELFSLDIEENISTTTEEIEISTSTDSTSTDKDDEEQASTTTPELIEEESEVISSEQDYVATSTSADAKALADKKDTEGAVLGETVENIEEEPTPELETAEEEIVEEENNTEEE